ncbi:hypothetical protein F2Q68_00045409 [Brassica cretica]|uniref:Uncharacterized protein n=1 Tax=Brassica cretica TaxID=69181 RepID=A0A8S9LKI7_BRACR|nr:hypothetical protein F2Q68_00045409 [Brassica cretica]
MAEGVRKRFGETVTGETKNAATLNAKTRAVMFLIGDNISGGAIWCQAFTRKPPDVDMLLSVPSEKGFCLSVVAGEPKSSRRGWLLRRLHLPDFTPPTETIIEVETFGSCILIGKDASNDPRRKAARGEVHGLRSPHEPRPRRLRVVPQAPAGEREEDQRREGRSTYARVLVFFQVF